MATLRTAVFGEEDEVQDQDYQVDLHELHARSSSPSDGEEDGERPSKRLKTVGSPEQEVNDTPPVDINELYAAFKAPGDSTAPVSDAGPSRKKVKIIKKFKFAGEEHEEEVDVWDDSAEAVEYFKHVCDALPTVKAVETSSVASTNLADAPIERSTAKFGQGYERRQAELAASNTSTKAGPKRPKASLASLKASLTGAKATKISTLEKSKMDWNKYVAQNSLADDLEKGRKDGYTERQAFLERTQDRLESEFARQKSVSRRA